MDIYDMLSVAQDIKNNAYNFCKDGECIKCGNCCSNILPMTPREVNIIKAYIRKNSIKEQPSSNVMDCPFMDSSKELKCTIYEVRPTVCRDFICDRKQRPDVNFKFAKNCRTVMVRDEFFGGVNGSKL